MAWAPPPWSPRVFGRSFTSTIFAYPLRGARSRFLCCRMSFSENWLPLFRDMLQSTTALFKFLGQLRQGLVEVRHQPIVGDLKDGCLLIFIDRHNDLRVLHTGQMLNST